jgi:hypothetical protein
MTRDVNVAAGTTPSRQLPCLSPVSPLEELLQVGIVEEAVGIARFSVIAEGIQTLAPACPKIRQEVRVECGRVAPCLPGPTPAAVRLEP